ncbi:MAG: hypothetical protein NC548_54675 [Lachnospiraceae bacterium]|nr:hypothetical protein [Lachnospiraceae bacterium]
MNEKYSEFLESNREMLSKETIQLLTYYSNLGDYDYSDCTTDDLKELIKEFKPRTVTVVTRIMLVMRKYANFLNDTHFIETLNQLDRKEVWNEIKPDMTKKFFSNEEVEEIFDAINLDNELNNEVYYRGLIRCIYEGIYSKDLSVLKNLKSTDLNGNIITVREDSGNTYELEISEKLVDDIKELGYIDYWVLRNARVEYEVKTIGEDKRSCFKINHRRDGVAYYDYYYKRMNFIFKKYYGHVVSPYVIYISGMMHRIKLALEKNGFTLRESFVEQNRDILTREIIEHEMKRSNCGMTLGDLKERIRGCIDNFE